MKNTLAQRDRGRFLLKPKGLDLAKAKLRYNFAEKQKTPRKDV
jgi:hypothetical protein